MKSQITDESSRLQEKSVMQNGLDAEFIMEGKEKKKN